MLTESSKFADVDDDKDAERGNYNSRKGMVCVFPAVVTTRAIKEKGEPRQ